MVRYSVIIRNSTQIKGVSKARLTKQENLSRNTKKYPLSVLTGIRIERVIFREKNMSFS